MKDDENGGGDDDDSAENRMQDAGDDKGRGGSSQQVFYIAYDLKRHCGLLIGEAEWSSSAQQEFKRT